MYFSKEMTEKARAVIAGEIDIPCPIGWHTLYESNVLCAYACTLLRLPDAGIDADAIGAEDIRIFQYGVEHNIETVTGIMYSHEAAGITDGRYDGVGGSDLYRWIIGRCDDAEKWRRANARHTVPDESEAQGMQQPFRLRKILLRFPHGLSGPRDCKRCEHMYRHAARRCFVDGRSD